ncbi:Uncharacterized protein PECH_004780 [Penicillium ucsense]|uniref:Uncharacterized protein n=1 Tax=Penicillium ucsense TaxID=2839758 RepID=A0A8J8WN69_9EURO|nr:Uncharacterized protein PECM_007584 [Penicillium ucsense]KAF7739303.1 Uncharacterized protein PECH_004780 [Penicillium ucsense]
MRFFDGTGQPNSSSVSLQSSTVRWQQSTSRLWRRSVSSWFGSKDLFHQATVETWQKSSGSREKPKVALDQQHKNHVVSSESNNQSSMHLAKEDDAITPREASGTRPPSEQPVKSGKESATESKTMSTQTHGTSPDTKSIPDRPKPSQPGRTISSLSSPLTDLSTVSSMSSPSISSKTSPRGTGIDAKAFSPLAVDLSVEKRRPDEQVRDLLNYTDHVLAQAQITRQLRDTKSALLGQVEHNWIHSTMTDAVDSAQELAEILEPCKQDMAKRKGKGKISSANRKQWKVRNRERAEERQARLIRYHCRLDQVYQHLTKLKLPQVIPITDVVLPDAAEMPAVAKVESTVWELPSEPQSLTATEISGVSEMPEMPPASPAQPPIPTGAVEMPADFGATSLVAELPDVDQECAATTQSAASPSPDKVTLSSGRSSTAPRIPRKALPIIAELPCGVADV